MKTEKWKNVVENLAREEAALAIMIDNHMDANQIHVIGQSSGHLTSAVRTMNRLVGMYKRRHSAMVGLCCKDLYVENFLEEYMLRLDAAEKYVELCMSLYELLSTLPLSLHYYGTRSC